MIFFLTTRANRFPIDDYLFSWGKNVLAAVQPLDYERFLEFEHVRPGVYVFSDLELLTPEQRNKAEAQWNKLHAEGNAVHLINHPVRSLGRYELLQELRRIHMNRFNIYRHGEDLSGVQFPVFVRNENDHFGSSSALITEHQTLRETLAALIDNGSDPDNLLVTEFCDTSGQDGIYRKYSSFILDGAIIPRHIFFSKNWHLKKEDLYTDAFFQEELTYVQTNPHANALQEIFSIAGINYGRIDYGIKDGKIQVWEINTNPVILTRRTPVDTIRRGIHAVFADNFETQWGVLAKKYRHLSGNYAGERLRLYRKKFAESPEAEHLAVTMRQAKKTIATAFPPALALYKHLKKSLSKSA